ncbi:hypothetical protein [Streptomyces sp. Z26]|uniref:hypothetical protein n=1 Tax=Streptomyces sp. Z26 TaxID=2500177 RepID=UPI0019D1C21E|nr:hypothetical protein [Streptomyces sp. Z26]
MSVGFRPTPQDDEIIQAHKRPNESTSDVLRRALRALDDNQWQAQARQDMERIAASGEDLSDEPDDWTYDRGGQRPGQALSDRPGESELFGAAEGPRPSWGEDGYGPLPDVKGAAMHSWVRSLAKSAQEGPRSRVRGMTAAQRQLLLAAARAGSHRTANWKLHRLHAAAQRRTIKR